MKYENRKKYHQKLVCAKLLIGSEIFFYTLFTRRRRQQQNTKEEARQKCIEREKVFCIWVKFEIT